MLERDMATFPGKSGQPARLPAPYVPLRRLGQGGQGEAWLAWDTSLSRRVVVKKLLRQPDGHTDQDNTQLGSLKTVAALVNPGVPTVFAVVDGEGGQEGSTWIVSEFVEGVSLEQLIAAAGEQLGFASILSLAQDLASALAGLHGVGLVHGDVNPANVVVTPEGRARFIDFGLAQRQGAPVSGAGVPDFVAPERVVGDAAAMTHDRFSLGCLIYWLLEAPLPYRLTEANGKVLLIHPDVPTLPAVPEEVLWGCARALTDPRPTLRPDLAVLADSLGADARHLPSGSRDNLGLLVTELQSDAEVDGVAVDPAMGLSGAAQSEPSGGGSTWPIRFGRRSLLALLAAGCSSAVVAIVLLFSGDNRPIYSASISHFSVAPTTAIPNNFGEEWVLGHLVRAAERHWRPGLAPTVSLDLALSCHGRLCQLALAHGVEGRVHWHQQSLVASSKAGIWRGVIRDLALAAAKH